MSAKLVPKGATNLHKLSYYANHPLVNGIGKNLPEAYKRFWIERHSVPTPVHYIPKTEKYSRDPETGHMKKIQNTPIPLLYPPAFHKGLWGGCAVVKGYFQRKPKNPKIPHFWIPHLHMSVVYTEILDKYIKVTVTDRTISLLNKHYGLDHYLLQTSAADLQADFALKLKRLILKALQNNELPHKDPVKRQEVYDNYKHYLEEYDPEFIEWYGLSLEEACKKMKFDEKMKIKIEPLKSKFRQEFIEELKSGLKSDLEEKPREANPLLARFSELKSRFIK